MIILKKIKELRRKKGISQKEMAEKLNITTSTYQKIEQNVITLSVERFLDICRILGINSYNELLPAVNVEIVGKVKKVILSGSLAFDNLRNNANYSIQLMDDLIEKVKNDSIEKDRIAEEIEFIINYLSIIKKESFNQNYQLSNINELLEKID